MRRLGTAREAAAAPQAFAQRARDGHRQRGETSSAKTAFWEILFGGDGPAARRGARDAGVRGGGGIALRQRERGPVVGFCAGGHGSGAVGIPRVCTGDASVPARARDPAPAPSVRPPALAPAPRHRRDGDGLSFARPRAPQKQLIKPPSLCLPPKDTSLFSECFMLCEKCVSSILCGLWIDVKKDVVRFIIVYLCNRWPGKGRSSHYLVKFKEYIC